MKEQKKKEEAIEKIVIMTLGENPMTEKLKNMHLRIIELIKRMIITMKISITIRKRVVMKITSQKVISIALSILKILLNYIRWEKVRSLLHLNILSILTTYLSILNLTCKHQKITENEKIVEIALKEGNLWSKSPKIWKINWINWLKTLLKKY